MIIGPKTKIDHKLKLANTNLNIFIVTCIVFNVTNHPPPTKHHLYILVATFK